MNIILSIKVTENDAGLLAIKADDSQIMLNKDIQFASDVSEVAITAIREYLNQIIIIEKPDLDPHFGETPIPTPTPVPPIYETMIKKIENKLK